MKRIFIKIIAILILGFGLIGCGDSEQIDVFKNASILFY